MYPIIKRDCKCKKSDRAERHNFCMICFGDLPWLYPPNFTHGLCVKRNGQKLFSGRDLVREKIRIRDNHTCQDCNKIWQEGERRFDVHHLDEDENKSRGYDKFEDEENLITYCHACHLRLHLKRKKKTL